MKVDLEAVVGTEIKLTAPLGKRFSLSSTIVEGTARLDMPGSPKPLVIDETKFTVQ